MTVLGIETSCDETAAAVVRNGREILSSVVFSQVRLHEPHGGVVPEIACRAHVETLPDTIDGAMRQAGVGWDELDAIAVTYGPGLASSLLVGISAAKGLALRTGKPLVAVNHLQAHIHAAFMHAEAPDPLSLCPFAALVVSGGHTCLVRVDKPGEYRLLGQTVDDAAGEAFDKGATLLGLGYPGGPAMDRAARSGRRDFHRFPRGRPGKNTGTIAGMHSEMCFSFSGLKTSLLYYVKEHPSDGDGFPLADVAACYQEAIMDALIRGCTAAVRTLGALVAGGGVTLNSRLRERLADLAKSTGVRLLLAEPRLCGDNAAMIAGLAGCGQGLRGEQAMLVDACPNLRVEE